MQMKALPRPFYRRLPIDDSTPQQAIQRWEKLRLYDRLRRQGCCRKLALEAIGCSRWRKRFHPSGLDGLVARSRCPRRVRSPQWSCQDERLVWQMRRRFPFCGKLRWHLFGQPEHEFAGSVSTVGRILAQGVCRGRIRPGAFYPGGLRPKRRPNFPKGHAQRWRYGTKASRPGQLVQIDHSRLYPLPGVQFQEFKAICPITQYWVVRGYVSRHRSQRHPLPAGPPPADALPRHFHPSRRRIGVQGRVRDRLPEPRPPPLDAASATTPGQRLPRARSRHHPL